MRKEAAWITERDTIAVDKLKKKFVDNVATERIVVDACVVCRCLLRSLFWSYIPQTGPLLKTGHSVATFRTSKLVQAAEKHIGVSSAEERNDMPGAALVDEKPV